MLMITNIFKTLATCLYCNKHKSQTVSAVKRLRDEIVHTSCLCKEKTHKNKLTAVNAFEKFLTETQQQGAVLRMDDVTPFHIKAFEQWMVNKSYSLNYVRLHMRCLRALFNCINGSGKHLFKEVRTTNCQTEKRAVSEDVVKQLKDLPVSQNSSVAMARNIFLFCFYCMGMPLIDAVRLKKIQLKDNCISYRRRKTNRLITIPIGPELAELLQQLPPSPNAYLLPIITADNTAQAYHQYINFYQRYRRSLKELSCMLSGNVHLTSYVARHTWASIVYHHGGSENVIARALGHSSTNTTRTYITELCDTELVAANEIVTKALM